MPPQALSQRLEVKQLRLPSGVALLGTPNCLSVRHSCFHPSKPYDCEQDLLRSLGIAAHSCYRIGSGAPGRSSAPGCLFEVYGIWPTTWTRTASLSGRTTRSRSRSPRSGDRLPEPFNAFHPVPPHPDILRLRRRRISPERLEPEPEPEPKGRGGLASAGSSSTSTAERRDPGRSNAAGAAS